MTADERRSVENRKKAKLGGCGNVVCNALIQTFGYEAYEQWFDRCLTSSRFGALLAIASHPGNESFSRLVVAAEKVARNPKTKAML